MSIVFKWGSLVGLSLPSSGANQTLPFVAADVAFRPREFTTAITNDWETVPYCATDFAPYSDKTVDHLVRVHNPASGIGDICRYMGIANGSRWRIPTCSEWIELYGSAEDNKGQSVKLGNGWMAGSYYPLSGYAMGLEQSGVKITGSGADATVIGASKIDGAVFLPASGRREFNTGAIYEIGAYGFYWASTAVTSSNGYYMRFDPSAARPQWSAARTYAWSIRCIRE